MVNDWREAGQAWGRAARDWAFLLEPYARRANEDLFDALGVGERTVLLDVACGSGFAVALAADRGASVAGLDASEELIAIARARCPQGDLRIGDMFALPFPDANFDVVTSFNGIWKGCDDALIEAARVVRPGGRVGITFWGPPKTLGLLPYFMVIASLSPTSHVDATLSQGDTGRPGIAEAMFRAAGLEVEERGTSQVTNEWPDLDVAVRALTAAGPSIPALEAVGADTLADAIHDAIAPLEEPGIGLRITSEFGWLTGRRPD